METPNENITLTIKPDADKLAEISARSYQVGYFILLFFIQ